ncbi:MAG: OmpH family outer membrane protein [Bacteroidales bacterium]
MKSTKMILAAILIVAGMNIKAQTTYKFGHIKSQELIQSLPESEQAQKTLEAEQKSIRDQLELMNVEANNKINDYLENQKLPAGDPKKWSDIVKADKEKEIQGLQQRIQEFQQTASEQLQTKQNELYKPIVDKVDKAIKDVAKENKFTYIFDVNALLYFSEESIDITSMVKAKLATK